MTDRKKKSAVDHEARMAWFIKVIVDGAPPLTPEQRSTIAGAPLDGRQARGRTARSPACRPSWPA